MSKADELIAGLQGAAEFDSAGSFSLDREKARQKMRQFQLADPHRYVLLLVEAAVLRGAKTIEFEIDTDDMHMRFDAALEWEDLDELYTSLFVDRSSVGIRARRELALACNAAMALNPRFIRIESWGGDPLTGIRGFLRPDEQDEIERVEQVPAELRRPSTHIHVKDRFRPGLLVRFLHSLGETLPETTLIRERCALASTPISLNGNRVSFGLPQNPIAAVTFEAEGLRGVAGLHEHERSRSAVVLLSNGVEISTTDLGDSVPGLWFWVDASHLRKDVSQADVVRSDPGYEAMLHAIASARDRVLARLVELWIQGEFNSHPHWPADKVFDLLRRCFLRWADSEWLRPDAGSLGKLADLPLWRTIDQRWLSPRTIAAEADPERGVMHTHRDFEGVQPLGWGPIIHAIDGLLEVDAIKRVYTDAARDVTADLEREIPWERNRRRWQGSPHPPTLPRGAESAAGLTPIDIAAGEVVGQVVARPGARTDIRMIVDGCLLCEIEFDRGVLGLSAVLAGPFEPARDYAKLKPDRALATAALLLLTQVPALLASLAAVGGSREVIRASLLALARPDFHGKWLEAFGFGAKAAVQMVSRLGAPSLLPDFFSRPGDRAESDLDGTPTPIAEMLTFVTADDRRVSLAAIDKARRQRAREPGKVLFVDQSAPLSLKLDELILRIDAAERWLLTAIFGSARLHDDTDAYRRELGRRNFLARPRVAPSLLQATWKVEVAEGSIRGLVGIDAVEARNWQGTDPRKAKVEVIVEDRHLATLDERAWVPGVNASLVWDQAPVNAAWDGLTGSLQPLSAAVNSGVIAILEKLAIESISANVRPAPDVRRLLWMSMATPFVTVEHAAAWRRIRADLVSRPGNRAEGDFASAVEVYFDLLLLFPSISITDMRESLTLLLEDNRVPTRAAVLEVLGRANPVPSGGREFQRAVLERFELFEKVPLLELCSGAKISLAQLEAAFASTGEIAHVQDLSLHYETDEYVIVRSDPVDHVALLRMFGRDVFKEVSAWIHERRHQERFENQAPLAAIRVADHRRLVGVEFEREGITGEMAIPPWSPGEKGLMSLTFCHQRRIVQEFEIHGKQAVVAIIDDPEAPLSGDFRTVDQSSARMATIRKVLDAVLTDELLPALAAAYPNLDPQKQGLAREWIVDHWRRSSPRAGKFPNRLTAAGREFAELKLFVDVDQTPRSLAELSERFAKQRKIWFVEFPPSHSVPPPFPILRCRGHEPALIEELFEDVEDFIHRWRARVEGERRRERAPDLGPANPPANALVVAEIDRHELGGALWLPDRVPFDAAVVLGSGGKVLAVRERLDRLAAQGVVDGVEADDLFREPVLAGPQQRYLDARAIYLYTELLNQHQRDIRRPERPDFHEPESVRLREVRLEHLRRAGLELARARRRGEGLDAILGRLEQRLVAEPLLRLTTGRLISIDVARKARPQELAHLDIWNPDEPALDPSERARLLLGEEAPAVATKAPAVEEASPVVEVLESLLEPLGEIVGEEPNTVIDAVFADLLEFTDAKGKVVPPPPEPKRDLVGELLERIRDELRLLRERQQIVLSEGQLDGISADIRNGRELVRIDRDVVFDSTHPRFVRAMEDPDPIWVSFLASVAYTALNRWLDEVTDEDELAFHHKHAEYLLSGMLGGE